jgi:nitroreductase
LRSHFSPERVALAQTLFRIGETARVLILVYSDVDTKHDRDALSSVAAAIQNLLLSLHEHGLGAHWATGSNYISDFINRHLGVTGKELVAVIPVGFFEESPPSPQREKDKVEWVGF